MGYRQRLLFMGLSDVAIVSLAVAIAYLVLSDLFRMFDSLVMFYILIGQIGFVIGLLAWTEMYRPVFKYASYTELIAIIKSVTVAEVLFFCSTSVVQYALSQIAIPPSFYLISWSFTIIGIGGSRFIWRVVNDTYRRRKPRRYRTLIVGAGNAGVLVARELTLSGESDYLPVAFVDDDPRILNLHVYGLPVVGKRIDIPEVVKRYAIAKVVLAMPSAPKETITDTLAICKECNVEVRILPRVSDLLCSDVSIKMIREVKIEDLLGREPVQLDPLKISQYLREEVVLVTGAGGSIGSELCRQIASFGPRKLLLVGRGEYSIFQIEQELSGKFPTVEQVAIIADIKDRKRIRDVMTTYRPSVVFHAAAHKHVPLMELNPEEAVKNNIFGTKNVAECAVECGVSKFVLISTDKAVNPTSVMGATKRIAEMLIQGLNDQCETKFVAVRFGNVLGSRGSVIPIFKRQIQQGGPLTVTHPEMMRFFMTITEAAQLVIQAGALAEGGEIFILDMGKPVKISDLAQDLVRLSGLVPHQDVRIVYTGIRPGEKLREELLTSEEGMGATNHDRIFVCKPTGHYWPVLSEQIKELEMVVTRTDYHCSKHDIVGMLQQIVPTYLHNGRQGEPVPETAANQSALSLPSLRFDQPQVEVSAK
ncbi:polysaccharide biosynthesis protein [Brevibacillus humidisoli]|uniref:polysaccharide biosynthesis protein n=1 Tax=Brevibacillus humidisoli TaxID=2895522 RepID=UPI001E322F79|nr:nucleoside-diphosphate sugar epimerase/dehydratase [Brevibacillus humidisoli]UFJ42506.1 polysaccharide biosynthesis protein [Brevibacillus humidisoli]